MRHDRAQLRGCECALYRTPEAEAQIPTPVTLRTRESVDVQVLEVHTCDTSSSYWQGLDLGDYAEY